jgi:glucose/arabinose dehydrogenase
MRRLVPVFAISLATIAVFGNSTIPVAEALPAGFQDTLIGSVSSPTAVEQLPNGTVVVLEQASGRVRLLDPNSGQSASTPALDLTVCTGSERGLLGFTHDPDFGRTGRVYLFYTRHADGFPGGCVNRVSAFTMSGSTIDQASEQVLIDNISSLNGNHNGGDLEVGNDGYLYVAAGDAGSDPRGDSGSGGSNNAAKDLSLLNGKILRLDRFSGAPAPGNPVGGSGAVACGSRGNIPSTPGTVCREIFSWGLRNPYRFAFDPNTSATRFFINDVGQVTYEEVNEGIRGANYGWNDREGPCPQGQTTPCAGPPAGITDPIVSYPRSLGTFITTGAFIPDGAWDEEFDGGYLFVDGGTGKIWLRRADGSVDFNSPFADVSPGVADMVFVLEPDGYALWYTVNNSSQIRRISPAPLQPSLSGGPQTLQTLAVPIRAFDTRTQQPAARMRGGTTRLIDLDAPANARAALVNLTMVRPAGNMFATVWEPRTRRPSSSNINAPDGQVVANSSVVPLDDKGQIMLHVRTTTDVVVDVVGFFVDAPGATSTGRFESTTPFRLVDTREVPGPDNEYSVTPNGASSSTVNINVLGALGAGAGTPSGVAFIATGVSGQVQSSGNLTLFAGGTTPLEVSHLNVNGSSNGVGDRRANLVVAPLGSDGSIDVRLHNVEDVVLDVVGWFTGGDAPSSTTGRFSLLAPTREVDTRISQGFGSLGPNSAASLNPNAVPDNASAVVQNLTLTPSAAAGFVAAYPTSATRPLVSNLNATEGGQIRAALAITSLSTGTEDLYSLSGTELVVDIFGYFR